MMSKVTELILVDRPDEKCMVVGTKTEYRLCGILLYRKILYTPEKYGVVKYCDYKTEF